MFSKTHIATIATFLAFMAAFSPLRAEYLKLQARTDSGGANTFSDTITLEAGDLCEVLHFKADSSTSVLVFCSESDVGCDPTGYSQTEANEQDPVFVGPGTVYVIAKDGSFSLATAALKVERAADSEKYLPQNAVVIPSQPSGEVEIILESSTDLVNWNSASPGTYVTSSDERFFRIRAERQ